LWSCTRKRPAKKALRMNSSSQSNATTRFLSYAQSLYDDGNSRRRRRPLKISGNRPGKHRSAHDSRTRLRGQKKFDPALRPTRKYHIYPNYVPALYERADVHMQQTSPMGQTFFDRRSALTRTVRSHTWGWRGWPKCRRTIRFTCRP